METFMSSCLHKLFSRVIMAASQEYHLLHIKEPKDQWVYCLDLASVSIGRDSSNTIRLHDPAVSRRHAILLRMPAGTAKFSYQLFDGDVNGNSSKHGIWVNHKFCKSRRLTPGDRIKLGATQISYTISSRMPEAYYKPIASEATLLQVT